jgi:hypothetical protein
VIERTIRVPSGITTLFAFVLALTGMIFVHEFGHFVAARLFKIEVEEFGFGLPSVRLFRLFRWRGTFTHCAHSGFVREGNDPEGGMAGQRCCFAGPMMNLLTATLQRDRNECRSTGPSNSRFAGERRAPAIHHRHRRRESRTWAGHLDRAHYG